MSELKSWGLSRDERRMVLGIRAAGVLLVGLGLPILISIARFGISSGFEWGKDDPAWRVGTLLDQFLTKSVLLQFASSAGAFMAALSFGAYLMRCDPRPLLPRKKEAS